MADTKEKPKEGFIEHAKPDLAQENREIKEHKETLSREDLQKARELVEGMQIDDDAKAQAAVSAQSLAGSEEQVKLAQLLKLAKEKGVIFAVKTAQKLNDPYLLDMLHDKLAESGHYKEFLK